MNWFKRMKQAFLKHQELEMYVWWLAANGHLEKDNRSNLPKEK